MLENELINQGLTIAAMGMGVVLTFLCILIVVMQIMTFVVGKLNVLFPVAVQSQQVTKKVLDESSIIAAVIAAAKRF